VIDQANRDIAAFARAEAERQYQSRRHAETVHAIDAVLFQLEDLNLQGVDRVPAALRRHAGRILETLPQPESEEEQEARRLRFRVQPLMDVMFHAQEVLFRLRDPERSGEEEDEASLGA
jgi:hypothetical protein